MWQGSPSTAFEQAFDHAEISGAVRCDPDNA